MSKFVKLLTGLIFTALIVTVTVVILLTYSKGGGVILFNQASRCDEAPSSAQLTNQGIAEVLDQPTLNPTTCWKSTSLPENNPAKDIKLNLNNPQLRRIWYRITYTLPAEWDINKPLMIYIPRISAHAWQIQVNGRPIEDNRFDWRSTWNTPASATFYADETQLKQQLDIQVGIVATTAEGFSLTRIEVGDAGTIRNHKNLREYLQIVMPQAMSAVMLLLSFFFFLFWLSRRMETEYLIMVFLGICFGIMNLKYTLRRSDDPTLDSWFVYITYDIIIPWLIWLAFLFAERFSIRTIPSLEKMLWFFAVLTTIVASPIFSNYQNYSLMITMTYTVIGVSMVAIVLWLALISKNTDLNIIVIGLMLGACAAVNDLLLESNRMTPESIYLIPFGALPIFMGFLNAVQRRYTAAILGQERLNIDLNIRLAEREQLTRQLTANEAELRAQQQRLIEFERTQTLAKERQRLMHDMHDGLGSSLLSTLAAIECNNLTQEAVAEALRNCIEDLRLVIDSLEPTENDLLTLLATIRYRLGQRLDTAGLELRWEINDLPPLPWLEPADALNVLRLVQEAFVNVLKHAHASQVRVTTHHVGDQVEIQITDNGQGFDPNKIKIGRGTHSQRKRAERLGGKLEVSSSPGKGTTLRLFLPINKV